MCGIAGLYRLDGAPGQATAETVRRAVARINHRGPDHQAVEELGPCCLGHARLSIIDTSAQANQPMSDESGRYTITYNGELYNFKTLRSELAGKGHRFRTDCDTEVVLKAYSEFGTDCVDRFNGFFAFAIYDREKDELFAARDRMGIKPFYYAHNTGTFLLGSELDAVMAMKKEVTINPKALHLFFQLTYIPAPHSMIDGIFKLPPGHWLLVSQRGLQIESFFDLNSAEEETSAPRDPVELVRAELERSVEMRMMADVPLGSFLSGGIDSAIISGIATRLNPGLQTFSLGFPDTPYLDESKLAGKVAEHIGSHHHHIPVRQKDLSAHLEFMLEGMDEPFADSSALAVFILSKYSAQHVKVVLSGDGGDELFGGYRKHTALQKSEQASFMNWMLKKGHSFLPDTGGSRENKWKDQLRKMKKYAGGLQHPLAVRYWKWLEWTPASAVGGLLLNPQRDPDLEQAIQSGIKPHDLNSVLRADQLFLLPNDMLTKVDRMSMAHGLEVRTPFLDHRLVKKVNALPFSLKNNGKKGKIILREAFKKDLPSDVFNAPKKGFEIPIEDWLRGELSGELKELSKKQLILDQAVFNHEVLSQIIREFLVEGKSSWTPTLWSFFVFQRWWLKHLRFGKADK